MDTLTDQEAAKDEKTTISIMWEADDICYTMKSVSTRTYHVAQSTPILRAAAPSSKDLANLQTKESLAASELPLFLEHQKSEDGQCGCAVVQSSSRPNALWVELSSIWALAAPTVLANMLCFSRIMVSNIFLGRLQEVDLAGSSLAIGFCNMTGYSPVIGFCAGVDAIFAQAFGGGNYKLLQLTLQRGIIILQCLNVAIVMILWLNVERILLLCGQDPEISAVVRSYVFVLLPDLTIFALIIPMRTYLRSQCITIPLFVCAGICAVIHIPLNYLLVFKADLGYRGAALATVLSDATFVFMLFLIIWLSSPKEGPGKWCGWSWDCLKDWGPILRLSVPACASICAEWWVFEILTVLAGLLPEPGTGVATMSILLNCTYMFDMISIGVGASASTRIGIELGLYAPTRARLAAVVAWINGIVLGLIGLLVFLLADEYIARLLTDILSVRLLIQEVLPLVGLVQLFSCPMYVGLGVLQGCARPTVRLVISLVAFYFIGLPLGAFLVFMLHMGISGFWLGMSAGASSTIIAITSFMLYINWETEANRAQVLVKGWGNSNCSNCSSKDIYRDPHGLAMLEESCDFKEDSASSRGQKCSIGCHVDDASQTLSVPLLKAVDREHMIEL